MNSKLLFVSGRGMYLAMEHVHNSKRLFILTHEILKLAIIFIKYKPPLLPRFHQTCKKKHQIIVCSNTSCTLYVGTKTNLSLLACANTLLSKRENYNHIRKDLSNVPCSPAKMEVRGPHLIYALWVLKVPMWKHPCS